MSKRSAIFIVHNRVAIVHNRKRMRDHAGSGTTRGVELRGYGTTRGVELKGYGTTRGVELRGRGTTRGAIPAAYRTACPHRAPER